MNELARVFRLLGDEVRLRLLRLLQVEQLNVSELTSILGIAQSGVSRHLKLLKEAGLIADERRRGWTYARATERPELEPLRKLELRSDDRARLQEVLRHRKEEFREQGEDGRSLAPGRSWAAWARALGHLLPRLRLADLGCGEGYLAVEVARWASHVVAVDRSKAMLERARGLADRKGVKNIVWRRGVIEDLPLEDASVDIALVSQALHQSENPLKPLREAKRILARGGRVLVLDLDEHGEEWVRKLGDKWLGFSQAKLRRLLREAGFSDIRVEVGARRRGDPFKVLVASGVKR